MHLFHVLKAIGNNDFVGGNKFLTVNPFLPLTFILILYPISNRAIVGTKAIVIYDMDSNISMVLFLSQSNIKYTQCNVE
jgi:hypothetical protein